jgi:cell fate (sporulation/competence/biofilm development) regulator YlbF (YheA/YmcA/DUF963 family)
MVNKANDLDELLKALENIHEKHEKKREVAFRAMDKNAKVILAQKMEDVQQQIQTSQQESDFDDVFA